MSKLNLTSKTGGVLRQKKELAQLYYQKLET